MAEFTQTITVDCPHCKSPDVIKKGKRNGYQRYECKDCRRKFDDTGRSFGRWNTVEHIGLAVDMYLSGMSYKQIAELIGRNFDLPEPSTATVYRWVKEYGDFAVSGLSTQVPENSSGHWVADELQVRMDGKKLWLWNVMDAETRYLLASHLTPHRDEEQAITVFEKALDANGGVMPETITTDGLGSYLAAIGYMLPWTKHIITEGIYEDRNNNKAERMQKTIRSRIKTMDGLYNGRTGQDYLDRWQVDYNHFKDHRALGYEVPARAANVQIELDAWNQIVEAADEFKAQERRWKSEQKAEQAAQKKAEKRAAGDQPQRRQNATRRGRGRLD